MQVLCQRLSQAGTQEVGQVLSLPRSSQAGTLSDWPESHAPSPPAPPHPTAGEIGRTCQGTAQAARVQVTLNGHRGAVSALVYARSGALLASGSQDTDIVVWDTAEQAGLYRLRGHTDEITSLVRAALRPNALGAGCLLMNLCDSAAGTA